jgi:tetratricopeptide (TPR) repeat protein
MGLGRIVPVAALLVILTSAAAFGHGAGMAWDQAGRELSSKDQSELAQWEALDGQVRDFSKKGEYDRAAVAAEKALEIAKQSGYLGTVGALGASLCNLAGCYYNQAQYAKAEPLFQSMLDMYEKKLGPDNPTVSALLNNLGNVHEHQGHLAQAESFYRRALEMDEKVFGRDHPNVAVVLKNLAAMYRSTQRDDDAAKLEQRAAAIEASKR